MSDFVKDFEIGKVYQINSRAALSYGKGTCWTRGNPRARVIREEPIGGGLDVKYFLHILTPSCPHEGSLRSHSMYSNYLRNVLWEIADGE